MQAVIMAGGYGTRLKELTKDLIPKPMIKIAGKPLLQWQIETLKANGFDDIIVVVGHLGDQILNKFNGLVHYYEEDEPLGTAGALPKIRNLLKDEFFLIYGDLFFDIDFERMVRFHRDHWARVTALIHPNTHPYDSDLIEFDRNYRISKILFKDKKENHWCHNFANAGIYLLDKNILNIFPNVSYIDFEKYILPNIYSLYGYISPEYVKDIGTVDRYFEVCNDVLNEIPTRRNLKKRQKAIFLDRDGTINENVGLVSHPGQLMLTPYATKAIKLINKSEYLAIVITNQPVVARGLCSIQEVDEIHAKMEELLGVEGAYVNDIFFCPHHPDKGFEGENPLYKINCNCRKPKPGMIYAAAKRYNIDLSQSWMIGDTQVDYDTAINAGVKPIVTTNLLEAVKQILGE